MPTIIPTMAGLTVSPDDPSLSFDEFMWHEIFETGFRRFMQDPANQERIPFGYGPLSSTSIIRDGDIWVYDRAYSFMGRSQIHASYHNFYYGRIMMAHQLQKFKGQVLFGHRAPFWAFRNFAEGMNFDELEKPKVRRIPLNRIHSTPLPIP